jgi:hypothetical protein
LSKRELKRKRIELSKRERELSWAQENWKESARIEKENWAKENWKESASIEKARQ